MTMDKVIRYLASLPDDVILINLHKQGIWQLPETILMRFHKATTFICSNNQLTQLPFLPSTIQYLHLQENQLTCLPDHLPPDLRYLDCKKNRLRYLPTCLPFRLSWVDCGGNELLEIPQSLPVCLVALVCCHNQLTSLPASIATAYHLRHIDARNNQLTTLPCFPHLLSYLHVGYNRLTHIGSLLNFAELISIDIRGNNITSPPYMRKKVAMDCANTPLEKVYRSLYGKKSTYIADGRNVLCRFREIYYTLKFQRKWKHWLWDRVRRPKIEAKYAPSQLQKLLADHATEEDIQVIIDAW